MRYHRGLPIKITNTAPRLKLFATLSVSSFSVLSAGWSTENSLQEVRQLTLLQFFVTLLFLFRRNLSLSLPPLILFFTPSQLRISPALCILHFLRSFICVNSVLSEWRKLHDDKVSSISWCSPQHSICLTTTWAHWKTYWCLLIGSELREKLLHWRMFQFRVS